MWRVAGKARCVKRGCFTVPRLNMKDEHRRFWAVWGAFFMRSRKRLHDPNEERLGPQALLVPSSVNYGRAVSSL